uniref:SCP domain-containing protein n=1 Tax=Angiostrongylus cantonensis TaxID=6313 RepID=A0A158P930_ANGCA
MHRRLKVIVLLLGALLLIGMFAQFRMPYQSLIAETENLMPESECACELDNIWHDFCYRLPASSDIRGTRFNCTYAAHLKMLDLLSDSNAVNMKTDDMPKPMFVTAMSDSHYKEGLTLIANIRKLWPQQKLVVYNLGLDNRSLNELKEKCLVELRDFPFHDYPIHVSRLEEYRWKPIVIAEREAANLESPKVLTVSTFVNKKIGYFTASVYDFIPTLPERLRSKTCVNYDAGFAFVVRTSDAMSILKWYVICALEKNCMAPPGAVLYCNFGDDRFLQYANCHRYDQSVINLLLANSYDYNPVHYVSNLGSEGAIVDRTAAESFTPDDFLCGRQEERARFGDFTRRHLPLPSRGRKQRIADTVDEVAAGKSGLVNIEDLGRMDGTFSLRRTSPMNFKRAKLVPNMFMGPFCAKINRLSVQEREELEKPYIANLLETVRRHKLLRKENTDETMDSTTVRHAQLQAEAPTEKRKREHKPKSIDQATTTVLHAQLQVEAPKEKRKRGRRPKSVNQVNEYYVKAGVPYAELQVEAPKEKRKRGRRPKSVNQMNEYYVKIKAFAPLRLKRVYHTQNFKLKLRRKGSPTKTEKRSVLLCGYIKVCSFRQYIPPQIPQEMSYIAPELMESPSLP